MQIRVEKMILASSFLGFEETGESSILKSWIEALHLRKNQIDLFSLPRNYGTLKILLASCGFATSLPSSFAILTTRSTSSALVFARTPFE